MPPHGVIARSCRRRGNPEAITRATGILKWRCAPVSGLDCRAPPAKTSVRDASHRTPSLRAKRGVQQIIFASLKACLQWPRLTPTILAATIPACVKRRALMELTGTLQRIKDLQRRFELLRGYL